MDVGGIVDKSLNWRFLNEPFWRWFVFIIILSAALGAWSGALRYMRG